MRTGRGGDATARTRTPQEAWPSARLAPLGRLAGSGIRRGREVLACRAQRLRVLLPDRMAVFRGHDADDRIELRGPALVSVLDHQGDIRCLVAIDIAERAHVVAIDRVHAHDLADP